MSNERDIEDRDARVSDAYRETARETAPEALNRTILDMASGTVAKRPGGILFAGWVKPVAWAATIGLSLTIVLELTRAPVSMDAVLPAPASITVDSVRQDFETQENRAVEAAKALEQMQTGPNNQDVLEEVVIEDLLEETAVAEDMFEEPAVADTFRRQVAAEEAAQDEDISAFAADAPRQDQPPAAARSRLAGLAAPELEKKESDRATDCDFEARATADTWLQCIESLRKSGDTDAAEREYADFLLEHPAPEAHK
jgi:hypothetical protein